MYMKWRERVRIRFLNAPAHYFPPVNPDIFPPRDPNPRSYATPIHITAHNYTPGIEFGEDTEKIIPFRGK